MAHEFPQVRFAKVDVDAAEDVAEECGVTAMPTFQFYRSGARVAELCGAEEPELRALVVKHSAPAATPAAPAAVPPADVPIDPRARDGKKKRALEAVAVGGELGHGGKRRKGQPQPPIDTATKPIKWKKIIAKELRTEGGSMGLKALRKACVAEARAHPSHSGRDKATLLEEFDRMLPTFHKFRQEGGRVSCVLGADDE